MLKSSAATLATTLVIAVLGLISSVITARILGPQGRGLFAAALLIGMLAAQISQMGLASSYIYHAGAGRALNYTLFLLWSVAAIICGAVIFSLIGLSLGTSAPFAEDRLLVVGIAIFAAIQTYFLFLSQLQASLRFFNVMRIALVSGNLVLLLGLVGVGAAIDFRMILAAQVVVLVTLSAGGLVWAVRRKIWTVTIQSKPAAVREVLQYAFNHHGTVILGIIAINTDKFMLLALGTVEQFGFYTLAFTISRLFGALQDAVSTALFARFAGKDETELGNAVRMSFRLTFLPLLGVAAIGAAVSPWFFDWVYGPAFGPTVVPFAILLFECVIGSASWTLAQRFTAGGRPGLVLLRQAVSLLPLFAALPFLTSDNAFVMLAVLMLCGAVLRLVMTLMLFPVSLREPMPRVLPTGADLRRLKGILGKPARPAGQALGAKASP